MRKKHTALCCCVASTSLFFLLPPFIVWFQKCLGKKKHGPHQTKQTFAPASCSAKKIATIMDFSVKDPSKVDCKVWIIVIFCNAKEPRLNSVLVWPGLSVMVCFREGRGRPTYLWKHLQFKTLGKNIPFYGLSILKSTYQSKVHYGEQK